MNYKEHLTWILDKKNHRFNDDKYQENIDFVHSLGKKCDCVGWSELDMDEPDADTVKRKPLSFELLVHSGEVFFMPVLH